MTEIENETRQKVEDELEDDDDRCTDPKKFKNTGVSSDESDDEVFAKPRKPRSQQQVDEKSALENQEK